MEIVSPVRFRTRLGRAKAASRKCRLRVRNMNLSFLVRVSVNVHIRDSRGERHCRRPRQPQAFARRSCARRGTFPARLPAYAVRRWQQRLKPIEKACSSGLPCHRAIAADSLDDVAPGIPPGCEQREVLGGEGHYRLHFYFDKSPAYEGVRRRYFGDAMVLVVSGATGALTRHVRLASSSARRSPMMTQGAWVLPVVMVGITDASATRRLATP